jgi:hypothetical protein
MLQPRRRFILLSFAITVLFVDSNPMKASRSLGLAQDATAQTTHKSLASPAIETVELPGGKPGIGFDDMQWSSALQRVIVPGGRSSNLYLIDPESLEVTVIGGFSAATTFDKGHDFGVTSAVEAEGFLYATDRTAGQLVQIDVATKAHKNTLKLRGHPDYVRFIASTHELWVTEPGSAQIEIIALGHERPPALKSTALIPVVGGPESLAIDLEHGRAYTNSFAGMTFAIDLATHKTLSDVKNGCAVSLGIALDAPGQRVFVACAAGEIVELAAVGGALLTRHNVGKSIDIISYDPTQQRVHAASAAKHQLDVLKVAASGALSTEYVVPTVSTGSCVVSDAKGHAWLCDPTHGRVLRVSLPDQK